MANPLSPACVTFLQNLQFYNLPAARARELFKPSTDSTSLLVEIEKKFFRFGFGFCGGEVTIFSHFWPPLPGLGPQHIDPFF